MKLSIITDYINYSLAKREVPNMYIEGVGFGKYIGLKNRFSPIGLEILGLQKKD